MNQIIKAYNWGKVLQWVFISSIMILLNTSCLTEPDPCAGISCQNGGICMDGSCACPENTKGESCEIKIPKKLRLERIKYSFNSFGYCRPNANNTPVYAIVKNLTTGGQIRSKTIYLNPALFFTIEVEFARKDFDVNHQLKIEMWRTCPNDPARDGKFHTSSSFRLINDYPESNRSIAIVNLGSTYQISGQWMY